MFSLALNSHLSYSLRFQMDMTRSKWYFCGCSCLWSFERAQLNQLEFLNVASGKALPHQQSPPSHSSDWQWHFGYKWIQAGLPWWKHSQPNWQANHAKVPFQKFWKETSMASLSRYSEESSQNNQSEHNSLLFSNIICWKAP